MREESSISVQSRLIYLLIGIGHEDNFDKYEDDEVSAYGVEYDYGSAMHYSEYAFSVDDEHKTIIPYVSCCGCGGLP